MKRFFAVLFVLLVCTVSSADDLYDSMPLYSAPYYAGTVKNSVLNKALDELNYIRALIGVPDNVTLNAEYTDKAQHGAVLLDVIDKLTHTPSKPSDMSEAFFNLAYDATTHSNLSVGKIYSNGTTSGNMSLSRSIKSYMDDSDSSNISSVGHRRWLMNPRLKQTGFGLSTRNGYAAAYVIEEFSEKDTLSQEEYQEYLNWLKWPINDEFITWPVNKKSHPLTYFDHNTAWSVTLNSDVFDTCTKSEINVTLTRQSDNESWTFSASHSDGYFNVSDNRYAYDECIIFRPDNVSSFNNNETWDVNIIGLTRKDGTSGTISYSVTFTDSQTGYEDDDIYHDNPSNPGGNNSSSSSGGGCNSGFGLIIAAGLFIINNGIRRK